MNNNNIGNSSFAHSIDTLSVYFVNATSLAKFNALQNLGSELSSLPIDIALIAESWFNDKYSDDTLSIENSTLFRRDRIGRIGGGVCAYVRSSIDTNIYKCPSSPNNVGKVSVEIMWLTCFYKGQNYFIACCYHPPKPVYHLQYFVDIFKQNIEFIVSSHSDSIIMWRL